MKGPADSAGADPSSGPPALIFDWKHRPRTWAKLTFWLALVLAAHAAAFIIFRVRMPAPARVLPVPASIMLAPAQPADPADPGGHTMRAGRLSEAETTDLDLPEHQPSEPHTPSFADHVMVPEPWPKLPELAAWPEVSQVSRPVLPPVPEAHSDHPGALPPAAPTPPPAGTGDSSTR